MALATVYLVWGSTYFAYSVAVDALPPLLTAGLRIAPAGLLLYAALRLTGTAAPPLSAWRAALPVAIPMFLIAHGSLAWALRSAPSGTGALFAALAPMWLLLAGFLTRTGDRPDRRTLLGIGAGFAGVAALLDPASFLDGQGLGLAAAGALLLSSLGWGLGSAASRRPALAALSPLQTAAMAMTLGGAMLLASAAVAGETLGFDALAVPVDAWIALLYLALPGSLVAFTAYIWLLQRDGPARASTHSFVNPVIAVALGAAVAGEPFTAATAVGMVLVLAAVALLGKKAEGPHQPQVRLQGTGPAPSPRPALAALLALVRGRRVPR